MFRNYLKIAVRNLLKHKSFSAINIIGLSVGMAACVVIFLFVRSERSFDQFHTKKDRLFRVNKFVTSKDGALETHAITSGQLAPTLQNEYPDVESATRILPWFSDVLILQGNQKIKVSNALFVDDNFFDVFDFHLLYGNPKTALAEPQSVVLSQSTAQKIFGEKNPIGKTFIGLGDIPYTVTGIIENASSHSHIQYEMLMAWSSTVPGKGGLRYNFMNNWLTQIAMTYVVLKPGVDPDDFKPHLADVMRKYMPDHMAQYELFLQPFQEIYLHSADIQNSRGLRLGSIRHVYVFSTVSILILVIAGINFMNLSTARAQHRAREVGIRKVLGAFRSQLAAQFIGESIMMSSFAACIALVLTEWSLPWISTLAGYTIADHFYSNSFNVLIFGCVALATGLISGIYPALILSGFMPLKVLKGFVKSSGGTTIRKILVIAQFAISAILIVGAIVVYQQMNFFKTKDMGFDKEQMIVIPINNTGIVTQYEAFKNELKQSADIIDVTGSQFVPGGLPMSFGILPEGHQESENWTANIMPVDYNFAAIYNLHLTSGRFFSKEFVSDPEASVVINEALARSLGWKDPVGKKLGISGQTPDAKVIGVVKDFNFQSLHHAVEPLVMNIQPSRLWQVSVKIRGDRAETAIPVLQKVWEKFESKNPFEYYFLDERFGRLYLSEKHFMDVLKILALLAIMIAGLGLFGLASFMTIQRTKEIGIRKVLGATVPGIVSMISKDFFYLILIANLIAWPVAYVSVREWLNTFAYRIDIGFTPFIVTAVLAAILTIVTVSIQAIKSATANPVDVLKYE